MKIVELKEINFYMNLALDEAKIAKISEYVPIGAVLICAGNIYKSHNTERHAEEILMQNFEARGATIFVTVEPCAMCLTMMMQKRVKSVYFGCWNKKYGACGGSANLFNVVKFHGLKIFGGFLEKESKELIVDFFKTKRD